MSFGGILIALALVPLGIAMGWDHSFEAMALCWALACLVALIVPALGTVSMRFELMGTATKTVERAGAPPLGSGPE
jgi:hypothetical protein